MQINCQPIEKPVTIPDFLIDVIDIWMTIQGEGPQAGSPAVFIRLAGCNLQCPFCDTDYTNNRQEMNTSRICAEVRTIWNTEGPGSTKHRPLVVVTGGEPFRQKNLITLIKALMFQGCLVSVETNGTLPPPKDCEDVLRKVTIVCSPKAPLVNADLAPYISAWKYVLADFAVDTRDGLPTSVLGLNVAPARPSTPPTMVPVYVQPLDEKNEQANEKNLKACIKSCLRYGYRLSIQSHKLGGLK